MPGGLAEKLRYILLFRFAEHLLQFPIPGTQITLHHRTIAVQRPVQSVPLDGGSVAIRQVADNRQRSLRLHDRVIALLKPGVRSVPAICP